MRSALILFFLFTGQVFAANQDLKIVGWKQTDGIREEQAIQLATMALENELGVDDDGDVCGVEGLWNWEREKDLTPDRPERGEIFAITGFAQGPHTKMGCSSSQAYDCRVVFQRLSPKKLWKVEYVECEAAGPGRGQQ